MSMIRCRTEKQGLTSKEYFRKIFWATEAFMKDTFILLFMSKNIRKIIDHF